MAFTCKHFHYPAHKDQSDGTHLAFFKIFDGDSLVAVVNEPEHLNDLNAVTAVLFGKPAPKEHRALQVVLDIKNGDNANLKAYLASTFKERTFRFIPEAGWTWTDDPTGAEEMPWNVPATASAEAPNLYPELRKAIAERADLHAAMADQWARVPARSKDSILSALWDRYAKHWEVVMPAHEKRMSKLAAKVGAGESPNAEDAASVQAALEGRDRDSEYEKAFAEALSARVNG